MAISYYEEELTKLRVLARDFAAAHPELLDKSVLGRLYGAERLSSTAARTTFLLPEPLRELERAAPW